MTPPETHPAALVLGASGSIGEAIAASLARDGFNVALGGRSPARLDAVAGRIHAETGCEPLACPFDLARPEAPAAIVAATIERFGGLDLLVTSAAEFRQGDLTTLTPAQWRDGFNAMFFGAVDTAAAAWPHLVAARGQLVTISGIFALRPSARNALPSALAAALLNFTKSTAELGLRDGVRVNSILPGPTDGRRLGETLARFATEQGLDPIAARDVYASRLGVERVGRPEDVATLVAFLASEAAAHINGASIVLDGGWSRLV